eukprot:TRINITY_DN11419_c0_g1_i1.p1 TRINITY_DN11419_c0_g1~~TRINITY_DN11419_c0_g1_i1.p1  ORF type:complete len:221 (-),score=25.33 TRINITY_DN11419_c0_g1_i1:21-683(-)
MTTIQFPLVEGNQNKLVFHGDYSIHLRPVMGEDELKQLMDQINGVWGGLSPSERFKLAAYAFGIAGIIILFVSFIGSGNPFAPVVVFLPFALISTISGFIYRKRSLQALEKFTSYIQQLNAQYNARGINFRFMQVPCSPVYQDTWRSRLRCHKGWLEMEVSALSLPHYIPSSSPPTDPARMASPQVPVQMYAMPQFQPMYFTPNYPHTVAMAPQNSSPHV